VTTKATNGALQAEAVAALSRLQGFGLTDADSAARIAVGASNAVAAVVASAHTSLFDTEPSHYATALERLADPAMDLPLARGRSSALQASPSTSSPLDMPMTAVAALLHDRRVSSVELTQLSLARAKARHALLNCFIAIDDDTALAEAAAADAALAGGQLLGPLHGVPLAHKDMYYTAGRLTECGSKARRGFRPEMTATLLARMTEAGAITVGRLNLTEFALGPTGHNAHSGDCRNPWNLEHIACGSSSGSGAAVAARVVYASLGSDTGGSTRLPACANGVVGLKPTYSLLSRYGSMGLSFSIDTPGPLARTAEDLAQLLQVTAGFDAADPTSTTRTVPNYIGSLAHDLRGVRIGVPEQYFFDHVTQDVGAALDEALRQFTASGATVVRVPTPHASQLAELSRAVLYPETSALHAHWLRTQPENYSPQVRLRAATGLAIPASSYLEALQVRPRLLTEFVEAAFAKCDILFAPTLSIPVPTLQETGVGGGEGMWRVIAKLVHCTAPFNYLGLPAVSVPGGFAANGLPVGFQLVGRPFAEARLLAAAHAYQCATDWHQRAPTAMLGLS
jgi:aspartyl-tRNA(Asn)/glutamyl-tRNA(Gln) amidotransferase subunit A